MTHKNHIATIAAALLLTACGGGGGGSPATNVPPPPPPPPVDQNALQTTVPVGTYGAGSVAAAAFSAINGARQVYGVGLYAQNAKLDVSANNHAQYISQRWGAQDFVNTGHAEEGTKPGFTGVNPSDRVAFAGYAAASSGEDLAVFITADGVTSDPGIVAANTLLSGPYHRFSLFDGSRDVGIANVSARFPGEGGTNNAFVVNIGVAQGVQVQLPAQSWVGVWPAENADGVMYSFAGESPNPIPANNGACAGYPVSLQVRQGLTLNTTSFTLVETAGGAPVSVQLSTVATDKNPSLGRANTAYIIPFKPLKLGTKYTARFVGSAGNTQLDKTWSFTTMAQNTKLVYGCDPS